MANVKENGDASKASSESAVDKMETEITEEDREVKDEVEDKEQTVEKRDFEEEDREQDQEGEELDDETSKHLQTKDASNSDTNPTTNGVDKSHEENYKLKDSDHHDVEMHSNSPEPDKSVDSAGKDNEQGDAGNDATCDGSSALDVKNLDGVVKEENTKEMAMTVNDMETINDVSMAIVSSERHNTFLFDDTSEGGEIGTEEEQFAFMKELENLFREKGLDFKAPKFYGEPLNLLKLWRAVIKLGGYDKVTACKLWRQVGESFNPPKTCTTVSWTFRIFYEKALLEYERHKISGGELHIPLTVTEPVTMESPVVNSQASGSGRARRDAAARAMQGWHSQRLLGNGEVGDPIIKDKTPIPLKSREKHLKNIGGSKRKKPLAEAAIKASRSKLMKGSSETAVIDVGPPADWVKINVRTTKDCYEVYALVPGLLREEVRVQSDPAGRLVISGEPETADSPWGVTPFKKVVSLPSRIDPHQTSAVVTLHGQLFVRVPFEQSE